MNKVILVIVLVFISAVGYAQGKTVETKNGVFFTEALAVTGSFIPKAISHLKEMVTLVSILLYTM